jgi:hypothetical protein
MLKEAVKVRLTICRLRCRLGVCSLRSRRLRIWGSVCRALDVNKSIFIYPLALMPAGNDQPLITPSTGPKLMQRNQQQAKQPYI